MLLSRVFQDQETSWLPAQRKTKKTSLTTFTLEDQPDLHPQTRGEEDDGGHAWRARPPNFQKQRNYISRPVQQEWALPKWVGAAFVCGAGRRNSNEMERIKWILENQVYGCAPSNIIYNMVKNYVYTPVIRRWVMGTCLSWTSLKTLRGQSSRNIAWKVG